jgi:hypothetical protein
MSAAIKARAGHRPSAGQLVSTHCKRCSARPLLISTFKVGSSEPILAHLMTFDAVFRTVSAPANADLSVIC